MAYPHSKYEVMVAKDADLSATGDKGDWAPGYVPHYVRAVALVITNDIGSAAVVKVDKRPTAGSDTNRGDGDVAVINLGTAHVAGKVVYKDVLNVIVQPGEELVFECTDAASASDTAHLILYVEPVWENPVNNSDMVATS